LAFVCLFAAPSAKAQFFPFFEQPARPQPAPRGLTIGQIRAVLAHEGARLVGVPRVHGSDIVAIGRDAEGDRKRFTLDAFSGEVLDVSVIARHEDRPPPTANAPISATPLPPPEHAPLGQDLPQNGAAPAPAEAKTFAPPAANAGAPAPAAPRPDPADAALSPIKPLKPPGAPKVEPLPK
jgi:hypothetical protein